MTKYSIDTSAILDAWIRHYPHDLFPSFWIKFATLLETKEGIATELVSHELNKKDDGCHQWFRDNDLDSSFIELNDGIQTVVVEMMKNKNYQRLVEDRKGAYGADPFVIALAKLEKLTVVTGEIASKRMDKPKIPDVCNDMGIECINILELMRKENWKF
jgi:hypothetical protein